MKKSLLRKSCSLVLLGAMTVAAEDADQVVIERGGAKLTLADIDARVARLSPEDRATYAHRPENLGRLMDRLLLNRQLAIQARELKLDQQPEIRHDLELAIEEVLAVHRLNVLGTGLEAPDYTQLARERYQANAGDYIEPARRVVEHVLIKTEDRTDEEARALAEQVRAEALREGADFTALVEKYSEDSGKEQNLGRYTVAEPGQFVPEFEAAALALSEPGEITEPVKTNFGYHVLRLVENVPSRQLTLAEVEAQLVMETQTNHLKTMREAHVRELGALPENGNEALLLSLPKRYGGEVDPARMRPPVD